MPGVKRRPLSEALDQPALLEGCHIGQLVLHAPTGRLGFVNCPPQFDRATDDGLVFVAVTRPEPDSDGREVWLMGEVLLWNPLPSQGRLPTRI